MQQKTKVFCIGYNKTGTTTLEAVLTKLGYRMPFQASQERLVVEELYRGNFEPLSSLCKNYDAFQDLPFSQGVVYAAVDALFPGSKFILTIRESSEWFESLKRFHLKGILKSAGIKNLEDFNSLTFKDNSFYLHKNYLYNVSKKDAIKITDHRIEYDWSLVYNKEHRINRYEKRNSQIIEYFEDRPEQLLVIDITKEFDNRKIVEFLQLPLELVESFPHLNSSMNLN